MAKGSIFAVESEWKNKTYQNVQNLGSSKKVVVFEEKLIFSKTAKGKKIARECNWNWQFSQNIQKAWDLLKSR